MSYDHIAPLYDAAFDWESEPSAILPIWERLGRPDRVIEAACGPARLLATLLSQGVQGIGIDLSPPMLALAEQHLSATGSAAYLLLNERLESFSLDAPCGGAFCAVGSFGHLYAEEAAHAHLQCMHDALIPGAMYAIQLGLQRIVDTEPEGPNEFSSWEFSHGGDRLSYAWYGTGIDAHRAQEVQRSRIEWLSGPRAGDVVETDHLMRIWDWPRWQSLCADTGFKPVAALDPNDGFRELALDQSLHESAVAWQLIQRQ